MPNQLERVVDFTKYTLALSAAGFAYTAEVAVKRHDWWIKGVGLAALFAVATAVCRSAPARYALAVSALVLMMVSPVITFTWLRAQSNPAVPGAGGASTWAGTSTRNAIALSSSLAPIAESPSVQPSAMLNGLFVDEKILYG